MCIVYFCTIPGKLASIDFFLLPIATFDEKFLRYKYIVVALCPGFVLVVIINSVFLYPCIWLIHGLFNELYIHLSLIFLLM